MASYVVDAVGLLRYLIDALPTGADEAFVRAERGIDVLWAPDVQFAEVLYQVSRGGEVAGIPLVGSPNEALRGLVAEGPVTVASIGADELRIYGSIADHYSMHDGLLVACHRSLGTDAIVTKDDAFADLETVWD